MKHYQEIFDKLDIKTSQILLTRKEITEDKSTYLNIKNTIEKLIEFKIIPIINENDVVSTEELEGEKFGDNDTLSAFVSNIIDANLLIILSSIEGLFTTDPNLYPQSAKLISEIKNVGIRDIDSLGGPTTNNLGTGGMNTKLKAIELASVSGTDVIIASGKNPDNILKIINGEKIGTFFPAKLKIIERKKRWLLNNMSRSKSLTVDEGAKNAILQNNTSLLPPGIISVSGSFKAGEVVCILDKKKQLIACGITSYSNKEINKIKGKQSTDIINNLGYIHTEEIIHKNNLVNL
jgi:glutamate 5-kinase